MSEPIPDWAVAIPSHEGVHQTPATSQPTRPFTPQQLLAIGAELLEQFLRRVVQAVMGVFPGGAAAFDLLSQWASDIAGGVQQALNDVSQLAWNLLNDPVGTLGQIPMMLVDGLESTIDGILDALQQVPVIGDIVRVLRSFGSALLGAVPVGFITDDSPSMLVEGGFDAAETIHPDSVFEWRAEGVPGTSPLGSAWVEANGSDLSDATEIMPVGADWELEIGTHVKWASLAATAGQNAIRLNVIPYVDPQTPHPSGAVMVASVESPSGDSSSDKDGWVEIVGTWSPPVGVTHFAVEKHVTSAATAGSVGFDETYVKATQKLPQKYTANLPEDLSSLFNWIGLAVDTLLDALGETPVGPILDRILDLGAALEGVAQDAWDAATDVAQLMTNLLTDPASVIGTIPQSLVSGLQSALSQLSGQLGDLISDLLNAPATIIGGFADLNTQFNQILEILAGGIVTPVNSLVQAVKDWFNQWFGGGSNQAIPLSQKGAPNGVTPLGPNQKIPIEYFPDGFTPSEVSHPHFVLTLDDNVPVPNNTETVLSGWQVAGSVEPLWEDSTNTRWRFDGAGWWYVDTAVAWESNANGSRQSSLTRRLVNSSLRLEQVDSAPAMVGLWPLRTNTDGLLDVSTSGEFSYGDYFDVRVWQDSGGDLDVLADGTVVKALYVGERIPDSSFIPPVEYDNRGDGASNPSSTTLQWQHQASGTDRAVVAFVQWGRDILSNPPTVTYGGQPMDLVAWARHNSTATNEGAMAAYILLDPPTTTQTVTVTRQSGSLQQFRGNTVSYTGVGGYTGYTKTNNDGGMPITVPSAPGRRVANAIASTWTGAGTPGQGVIDGYQRTVRFSFSPGQRGGMYGGDAPGAATVEHRVTTTGGRWVSCTVDLHDTS